MDVQIRPCGSADEVKQAISPITHYFGRSAPNDDYAERLIRVLPAERVYGAWEDGCAVGGLGAFPFCLTIPGGRVAAAGVTVAGVLPTHRRRGLLRAMMRDLLDACHRRGEPVAYLWATEDTIYGRFGFGLASFTAEIDLPRERSAIPCPVCRVRACSSRPARCGRGVPCSNLRPGRRGDAGNVCTELGMVAGPNPGRSGLAAGQGRRFTVRGAGARRPTHGLRTLSDELGI